MKRVFSLTLILLLAFIFLLPATSLHAAAGYITLSGGANTCSATGNILFQYLITGTAYSDQSTMTVQGVGQVANGYDSNLTSLPDGSSGGYTMFLTTPYSVAAHTPITVTITSYNAVNQGGGVAHVQSFTYDCTTGEAVNDVAGPPIPSGFVLKTITCDVAVFDAPGGSPVGSNKIVGGQTWYVNPTPKKDAAGKSWTEVFVAGYTNGYVPTSCVH
jgi:hypothetical protein